MTKAGRGGEDGRDETMPGCETIPITGRRVSGKTRVARGVSNENGGVKGVLQDFDSPLAARQQPEL